MTVAAIVIVITQFLMKAFDSVFADFAGKWKLVIVSALSIVLSVATGLATGMTFLAALTAGATLSAVQVFLHQIYVQFFEGA